MNQIVVNVPAKTEVIVQTSSGPGPTGPQGPAATVAIGTVQTVSPSSPAEVTNSGTAGAAVLNFQIPQGATGNPFSNVDGGYPETTYGGVNPIDGGGV